MIQQLAEYDGRIAKIEGPARSGKTEILVRRCVRLLNQGVEPESILVVVSSAFAQAGFRQRLQRAAGDRLQKPASRVVVSRALDVCASILDEPAAREATGRAPRILVDDEYLFFLEDLKTLGQKNQRLSNMLSFFYAQWSAFEDEDAWLIPGEETAVLGRARDALGLYGAMLRHEAPYLCGKLLLSEAGASLAGVTATCCATTSKTSPAPNKPACAHVRARRWWYAATRTKRRKSTPPTPPQRGSRNSSA